MILGYPHRGLTAAEVVDRIAHGKVNRGPRSDLTDYRVILTRNLFTLFNALMVPAAVALFLLGDLRGAWSVSAMAVVNVILGLSQEFRAKRQLDRLDLLSESKVRVIRDSAVVQIAVGNVVLGDILILAPGVGIVADGTVLDCEALEVDEALLTGESDPQPRQPGEPLLSGSFVVSGMGHYRADRVGLSAFANRTAAAARRYQHAPGTMQRSIDSLLRFLTTIAVLLCGFYVVLHFTRALLTVNLVQMVAATITSLVPQGLVLMTTLALTLGAMRLAARGVLVQRLSSVEAMASVDIVCTDKTGTLTTGNLTLDRIDVLGGDEAEVREKLKLFAWATIDGENRSIQALRSGLGKPHDPFTLIDRLPFKSQNRFSAVRVRSAAGEQVFVLGSLEALRPRFLDESAITINERFEKLLPSGLRLLAFAQGESKATTSDLAATGLRPLAIVALADELRLGVIAILDNLSAEGVRFVILSGDHPATIRAAIAKLNLPTGDAIHTGADLELATDRDALIAGCSVFGRVSPEQKLEIVTTLQRQGHRVAMIGDGVNDILAIKKADLGIAMGSGAAAAKTVADLVLENNNFDLLPVALAEGRRVLNNVHRAAKLFLLKNVYALLFIAVLVGLYGEPFPFLPQQVTLLNALTIGGPVMLIMLSKSPHMAIVRISFLREVGRFAIGMGLGIGCAGLVLWHDPLGHSTEEKRTLLLSLLVLSGLCNVVIVGNGNHRLIIWVVIAILLYVLAMYIEPLAYFFVLTPLTAGAWAMVMAATITGVLLGWFLTRLLSSSFRRPKSEINDKR